MKMKKRVLAMILAAGMLVGTAPVMSYAEEPEITVTVDGAQVAFDQPPVMVENRTLVPLRAIFEALGANVQWNEQTQTVFAAKRLDTVSLQIGKRELYQNDQTVMMDVPAQIMNDRTMVPVRAISEAFDLLVQWDGDTKTVIVESEPTVLKVTDHYLQADVPGAAEDVTLLNVTCGYPQIDNPENSEPLNKLNAALVANAQAYLDAAKEQGVDFAKEAYEESLKNETPFTTLEYTRMFDVTYNDMGIFSVANHMTETTAPGRTPVQTISAQTYNVKTGEEIAVTDLITVPEQDLFHKAASRMKEMVDVEPSMYLETAADTLSKEDIAFLTYPTAKGLALLLQAGVIAPEAAGPQFVILNYQENGDLFHDDYTMTAPQNAYDYMIMKKVGADRGWKQNELTFTMDDSIHLDNIECLTITVTRGEEMLGTFAVSGDLLYFFEYDSRTEKYDLID